MKDASAHLVSTPLISRMTAFIAAGLLILVGVVLQLGELLSSRLNETSDWLIHMIAMNLWNAIVLRLNALGFGQVLHFWPLLLVAFGLAILLTLEPKGPRGAQVINPLKLIEIVR